MGVPRLYPYIQSHFPKAFKHIPEGEYVITLDYVGLDANALLHGAAQEVGNYGEKKRLIDPYSHLSAEEKRTEIFKLFFDKILMVTRMIKVKKTLYIAIDGPAPMAKQAQQRQRRFEAALRSAGIIGAFNSNMITPGTVFMLELTKYMNYRIRREINTGDWKEIQVIFSPPTVAGEGEHKIEDYFRRLPENTRQTNSFCIFGPDGDLIMLTLSAHLPNIYLFREDQYEIGYYDLVNMGLVRKELPYYLYEDVAVTQRRRTLDEVSDDFVLIGFFVGNDFLPHIKMFYRLEDGLEKMSEAYGFTTNEAKNPSDFLTIKGRINHKGFLKFVSEIAKHERSFIANQSLIPPKEERFRDTLIEKHVTCTQLQSGVTRCHFTEEGWKDYRKDYYAKSNLIGASLEKGVVKICADYYKTLVWIFYYYVEGLKSWEWFYAWHYPPLMEDLVKYMSSLTSSSEIAFEKGEPSLPFVQLLSVLPPSSAYLLPPPLRKLATSEESPLVKKGYYPDTFEIDYEGIYKEHMAVALLPFVDVKEIRKAYAPVAAKLKNTYVRNEPGKIGVFRRDPSVTFKYESDYGTIAQLHVIRQSVDP